MPKKAHTAHKMETTLLTKLSDVFCVRNLQASEIFRDLIFHLTSFSKPISSFLDENILTSFLFFNSDFARNSITCDLCRKSLKRGTEKLNFVNSCCQIKTKVPKLGEKGVTIFSKVPKNW